MKHWPFEVVSDGGKPKIEVQYKGETKNFYPEEVSLYPSSLNYPDPYIMVFTLSCKQKQLLTLFAHPYMDKVKLTLLLFENTGDTKIVTHH